MKCAAISMLCVTLLAGCAGRIAPWREDVRLNGSDYVLTVTLEGGGIGGFCGIGGVELSESGGKRRDPSNWYVTVATPTNVTIGESLATCPTVLPNGSAACLLVQRLTYRCQQVQISARAPFFK